MKHDAANDVAQVDVNGVKDDVGDTMVDDEIVPTTPSCLR
jgi:hypothetical protein